MNKDQKAVAHIVAIPIQVAIHNGVDASLRKSGVGNLGRGLAQLALIGLGLVAHNIIENSQAF